MIPTRELGRTGRTISEIGLGTNAVGGHNLYENLSEDAGVALVRRAVERGITFVDTADVYGLGRSEELVGKALAGVGDEVVLATKGANIFADGKRGGASNEPAYMRRALEASLARLGRDHVDLYYIHKPDGTTPPDEALGGLLRLKEEGKIRYIGVSNFSADQVREALKAGPIDAVQSEYHLFNRAVEADLLPLCRDKGISFVPWGPIAFGLLGGKYTRDFRLAPGDWRNRVALFAPENFARTMDAVEALAAIAEVRGVPLVHLAMRWVLRDPVVSSTITGAKTPAQVDVNVGAAGWDLTDDELAAIDRAVEGV